MSRTWFVTGCSSGLGRAVVEAIIETDDRVVATARDRGTIADLEALAPDRVRCLALDIRDRDQVKAVVAQAIEAFGMIDILLNNAAISSLGAIEEMPEDEIERVMGTNFWGTLHVTRALLPHFRARRSGHILVIAGPESGTGIGYYAASKQALEAVFATLALETAHLGIRITMVPPGWFKSGIRQLYHLAQATEQIADYEEVMAPRRENMLSPYPPQVIEAKAVAESIVRFAALPDPPARFAPQETSWTNARQVLVDKIAQLDHDFAAVKAIPNLLAAHSSMEMPVR